MFRLGQKIRIIGCGYKNNCKGCRDTDCRDSFQLAVVTSNNDLDEEGIIYGVRKFSDKRVTFRHEFKIEFALSEKFLKHKAALLEKK